MNTLNGYTPKFTDILNKNSLILEISNPKIIYNAQPIF